MAVYLAQSLNRSILKIGFSLNPEKRVLALEANLRQHAGKNPGRFAILYHIPGDRSVESELLKKFAWSRLRYCREWMKADPEIVRYFANHPEVVVGKEPRGVRISTDWPDCGYIQPSPQGQL